MLTRVRKEEKVAELKEKLSRATCVYIADYRGLGVESVNLLRRRVRQEGAGEYEYQVAKNRLLKLAVQGSSVAGLSEHFEGPTAVALSYGDPAGLAKILNDFSKEHDAFEIKGASAVRERRRPLPRQGLSTQLSRHSRLTSNRSGRPCAFMAP